MKGISSLIVIAAVALLAAGAGLFSTIGFSTLSLSRADFVSNDPDVGGEAWVLLIALSGSGESAQGSFNAEQIQDASDNVKATQNFEMKSRIIENKIEYTIQNDFDQFYTLNYQYNRVINVAATENNCKNTPGFFIFKSVPVFDPFPKGDTVCILKQSAGIKGIIRDDFKRIFTAEISTVKGGIETKTNINTIDAISARLGDFGFVRWEGFLATDVNEPTPSGQDVCALYNNGWKTIDCSDFQSWKSKATPESVLSCLSASGSINNVAANCVQNVNNAASLVQQGKAFTAIGGSGQTFSGIASGTESSGKVTIDLPRLYTIPLLTMKLKTSYIGKIQINIPVGKPDIISVSSQKFQTGSNGFISVTVKNIGTAMGAFDVSATCNPPFSSNDRIRINLDPQETDIILLTLTASVTQPITGTCTVKASDVNNPNNFDTAQVGVEATNIQICNPGTKKAEGRFILQCNQFGSGFDIIKECREDERADPITFECVKEDEDDGDGGGQCGIFDPVACFRSVGEFIIIALVLIAIIVVGPDLVKKL